MDMLTNGFGVDPCPGLGYDQGNHPLAEARVGRADNDGVPDLGVVLQRSLHLIGEDLLAAGVDAQRHRARGR